MNTRPIRWGILGTALIARKNWHAILNTGNGIITAVASRDIRRARQFIAECQTAAPFAEAPRAFGDYEALLASPEIDAVYIPLPTGIRKEWVLRAAAAGKHIVCEKPCAVSVAALREMLEACRRNGVQFMDGVMFMHSRRLDRLREVLDDGSSVGAIRRISAAFSFAAPPDFFQDNIRGQSTLEPLGCLGDLGWYCLRFALWTMNWRTPRAVTGTLLKQLPANGVDSVPTEFSGELLFDDGASADFFCSFLADHRQSAVVSGTRGHVIVPDFVLPYAGNEIGFEVHNPEFEINGCEFNMRPRWRRVVIGEHSNNHPSAQETNLFRTFADILLPGRIEARWPEMALKTQQLVEACLASARRDGQPVEPGAVA